MSLHCNVKPYCKRYRTYLIRFWYFNSRLSTYELCVKHTLIPMNMLLCLCKKTNSATRSLPMETDIRHLAGHLSNSLMSYFSLDRQTRVTIIY